MCDEFVYTTWVGMRDIPVNFGPTIFNIFFRNGSTKVVILSLFCCHSERGCDFLNDDYYMNLNFISENSHNIAQVVTTKVLIVSLDRYMSSELEFYK